MIQIINDMKKRLLPPYESPECKAQLFRCESPICASEHAQESTFEGLYKQDFDNILWDE